MKPLPLVIGVFNLVLLIGLGAAQGASSAEPAQGGVVRARAFQLVDTQGRVRAGLVLKSDSVVELDLVNESGGPGVKLGMDHGGSWLLLTDDKGQVGVQILSRGKPVSYSSKLTGITLGRAGRERILEP